MAAGPSNLVDVDNLISNEYYIIQKIIHPESQFTGRFILRANAGPLVFAQFDNIDSKNPEKKFLFPSNHFSFYSIYPAIQSANAPSGPTNGGRRKKRTRIARKNKKNKKTRISHK